MIPQEKSFHLKGHLGRYFVESFFFNFSNPLDNSDCGGGGGGVLLSEHKNNLKSPCTFFLLL